MEAPLAEQCPLCGKLTRANRRVCDHCNGRIRESSVDDRRAELAGLAFAVSFGLTWFIGSATCAMHNNPDGGVPWRRQHADTIIVSLWGVTIITALIWFWLKQVAKW